MTTPAKSRPSAIPTPGRISGIPTQGTRSRSSSIVYQTKLTRSDNDDISRALAEAIKANDPSQHRPIPLSASSSSSSLSPQAISHSLSSGRRSVASRPTSSASTSSARVQELSKTPVSARPTSRPTSRQSDVSNRLSRTFEVGDNVRIESLGFEGILRYVGDIEGKAGLWAGVELSGGFTGKGKNDGSVAGYDRCCTPCSFRLILNLLLLSRKQYFLCPEKCGVFVATTKLSPPTVGSSAVQTQRPPSVASSRGGRTTPAMTGRMTPSYSIPRTPSASFSNGRVTPSSTAGRSTPGITKRIYKTPTAKPPNGASLTDKITAGSRAAKYMNMTAQQLNSRELGNGAESPTRKSNGAFIPGVPSPTISRTLSSPSRPPGSPFSTPRAGSGRFTGIVGPTTSPSLPSSLSRTSVNTPRPRVLSSVAMPPPPSPKLSQQLIIDSTTVDDATLNAEARSRPPVRLHSRPSSSISFRSNGTEEVGLVEQLQSRLDALEYENERLRTASEPEPATDPDQLKQMQLEKLKALDRASELEAKLAEVEQDFNSRGVLLQTLETQTSELTTRLNEAESEAQNSTATYKQDAETYHSTLKSLQDQLQELEGLNTQKDDTIQGYTSDITTLKDDLERARVELEEEKKELGFQIDELRIAGQVSHV